MFIFIYAESVLNFLFLDEQLTQFDKQDNYVNKIR